MLSNKIVKLTYKLKATIFMIAILIANIITIPYFVNTMNALKCFIAILCMLVVSIILIVATAILTHRILTVFTYGKCISMKYKNFKKDYLLSPSSYTLDTDLDIVYTIEYHNFAYIHIVLTGYTSYIRAYINAYFIDLNHSTSDNSMHEQEIRKIYMQDITEKYNNLLSKYEENKSDIENLQKKIN